jgi:hypothetical protein
MENVGKPQVSFGGTIHDRMRPVPIRK